VRPSPMAVLVRAMVVTMCVVIRMLRVRSHGRQNKSAVCVYKVPDPDVSIRRLNRPISSV
jgi:hypothetical protein